MFPWRSDHYSRPRSKYKYSNIYLYQVDFTHHWSEGIIQHVSYQFFIHRYILTYSQGGGDTIRNFGEKILFGWGNIWKFLGDSGKNCLEETFLILYISGDQLHSKLMISWKNMDRCMPSVAEMYWPQPPSSRPDSLACVCCLAVFSRTVSSRRRFPFSILACTNIGSLVWEQEAISGMLASSYFLQRLWKSDPAKAALEDSLWFTWTVSCSFVSGLQSWLTSWRNYRTSLCLASAWARYLNT